MKLWLSLPVLLAAACSIDRSPTVQPDASDAGSRSSSRVRDTGGGIDTIRTSQRRIDPPAEAPSTMSANTGMTSAASGKGNGSAKEKAEAPPASARPQRMEDEDAGPAAPDAGSMTMLPVAGMSAAGAGAAGMLGSAGAAGTTPPTMNTGSCCEKSDKPGCGTPETQACVCALQPACCTTAWTETCTFVVAQKFCQPGVRECVCGNGMGQWQQFECCAQSWSDTCDSVAVNKCSARAGCF